MNMISAIHLAETVAVEASAAELMTLAVARLAATPTDLRDDDPRVVGFDEMLVRSSTTRLELLRVWHLAGKSDPAFRAADDAYDAASEALLLAQPPTWRQLVEKLAMVIRHFKHDSWARHCVNVDTHNLLHGTAS